MKKKQRKYKGVQYIATQLKKYQPKKYISYTKALPEARRIFTELKSRKQSVTLNNIWSYSRTKRIAKKTGIPHLRRELLEQSYFFDLVDYPAWITSTTNEIWFTSKLWSSQLNDLQGGQDVSYKEYFAPYVNYVNDMKALTDPSENRYMTDWFVRCTEPKKNPAKNNRWESKIISVDDEGAEFDYGFDSKNPTQKPLVPILANVSNEPAKKASAAQTATTTTTTTQTKPKGDTEYAKMIIDLIDKYREDAKAGLITKKQYQQYTKELNAKLKAGGVI